MNVRQGGGLSTEWGDKRLVGRDPPFKDQEHGAKEKG